MKGIGIQLVDSFPRAGECVTQVCAATHKCVNEVMRWSGIVRMGRIGVMTAWELGNNTLNYLDTADPKQIAATFIICTDGLEIQ